MNKKIDDEILLDPEHPVTHTLIYIHSMETFIYHDLKKASLNKDISKVKTLGPYAYSITFILNRSLTMKLINDKQFSKKYLERPLYRGLLIDKENYNE